MQYFNAAKLVLRAIPCKIKIYIHEEIIQTFQAPSTISVFLRERIFFISCSERNIDACMYGNCKIVNMHTYLMHTKPNIHARYFLAKIAFYQSGT